MIQGCPSLNMAYTLTIQHFVHQLFQTQRWTLQHGTTTAAYTAPYRVESAMELVSVIGKSSVILTNKFIAGICTTLGGWMAKRFR